MSFPPAKEKQCLSRKKLSMKSYVYKGQEKKCPGHFFSMAKKKLY